MPFQSMTVSVPSLTHPDKSTIFHLKVSAGKNDDDDVI